MPRRSGAQSRGNRAGNSKKVGGRRQILLHLPKELCGRLKNKASQENRTISAQTELYLEVMLRLSPAEEFALIQEYRATVGG
jgi:hypothetical protein